MWAPDLCLNQGKKWGESSVSTSACTHTEFYKQQKQWKHCEFLIISSSWGKMLKQTSNPKKCNKYKYNLEWSGSSTRQISAAAATIVIRASTYHHTCSLYHQFLVLLISPLTSLLLLLLLLYDCIALSLN